MPPQKPSDERFASPGAALGDFARAVQSGRGQTNRMQMGVELAVQLIDGCDHAGVTVISGRRVTTEAATDDTVRQGDSLQYELDEGPCLDSVRDQHTVICHDLRADPRWSQWSPRVVDGLGVHAMMSLLLFTKDNTLGALNLYADRASPWDDDGIAVAHALAGHLAAAMADAREIEGRGQAMIGRTVIGQAEGILMERFGIDADRAFDYLRRISQDSNRKLVAVAQQLVTTRRLPDQASRRDQA